MNNKNFLIQLRGNKTQPPVGVRVGEIHNEHKMVGNTQMVVHGLQSLPQPILEGRNFLSKFLPSFCYCCLKEPVSSISPILFFPNTLDLRDITKKCS